MRLTVAVPPAPFSPVGILLAAGSGSRYGGPKSLVCDSAGTPWLVTATELLRGAGCLDIVVVLGAAPEAAALIPLDKRISVIVAADWARGLGSSLRAGLKAASELPDSPRTALITLVDLPELPLAAARRVAIGHEADDRVLRYAGYRGRPGHPVLVGRDHWGPLAASLTGDVGARGYLAAHGAALVECGDLGDGHDIDTATGSEP